jgi:predicted phage-related endonuclease
MSTQELNIVARDLKELRLMAEQLNAEIAELEQSIKAHMEEQHIDTIVTTDVKITWKPITSSRIDTAALKKALPDIAAIYTKQTTSRRFCVQ